MFIYICKLLVYYVHLSTDEIFNKISMNVQLTFQKGVKVEKYYNSGNDYIESNVPHGTFT